MTSTNTCSFSRQGRTYDIFVCAQGYFHLKATQSSQLKIGVSRLKQFKGIHIKRIHFIESGEIWLQCITKLQILHTMTKEATTNIVNFRTHGTGILVLGCGHISRKKCEFRTLGVGVLVLWRDQIHHKVKMRIEETKWRFLNI